MKQRLDPRSEIPSFQYILRSNRIVHSTGWITHNFAMNLSKRVDKALGLKNQIIVMFLSVNRRYFKLNLTIEDLLNNKIGYDRMSETETEDGDLRRL